MNAKLILYAVVFPLTLYSVLSLKLDHLFKKGKVLEIRILYILITMCISYLVVNFLYDFIEVSKIY